MMKSNRTEAILDELVPLRELRSMLSKLFPSDASLEWHWRQHRSEYIQGEAVFEIAGRLLAHPEKFKRIALRIGQRTLTARHRTRNAR